MKMLLFKEIVESTACAGRSNGGTSRVVGFTFNGGTGAKKGALIAYIFLGYPFGNRLRAFKICTGIEVAAVLTAA